MVAEVNEIGTAPARGRPKQSRGEVERMLSNLTDRPVHLPENARITSGPSTCPACGAETVMWGCDPTQTRSREEIHPIVWHETEWMADTFICRTCNAGWIEPDEAVAITWVRPYWKVGSAL